MKKFLFLIGVVIFLFMIPNQSFSETYSETLTFQWDWPEDNPTPENSGLPSASPIANDLEWHLYQRLENEPDYDYDNPVAIKLYDGNLSLSYDFEIDEIENNTILKVYFILKSFYSGFESDNSNETYIVINTFGE